MKKMTFFVVVLFIVSMLIGLCGTTVCAKDALVIKVAGISPLEYRSTLGLNRIAEKVEKATDGRIKMDVFPMNQLGDYIQVFEEIQRGTIEMGLIFIPSQYDVMLEIGSLPFLAENAEGMREQLSTGSYIYSILDDSLSKLGVKLLGICGEGFIGVGSAKKPKNYADPKADKDTLIRVSTTAVYKETAQDMGYRTTSIPYADTYSSIQTGVCDGWIGGSSQINYQVFRDVINYYTPYNCLFDQTGYLINQELWDSLSSEDQKIIQEAVNYESAKSFDDCKAEDAKYMDMLADKGIEILKITPEQKKALADHIRSATWPKLEEKFGKEVLDKVKESL
ncbi:MAG: TRAP transporter substrate-binding protein DctP [Candidatus Caldatribacteriota bacterium]|nr:TRAP transporter substrate-binding protein DctP [Candidatus Caldatribacteriota bacterium]